MWACGRHRQAPLHVDLRTTLPVVLQEPTCTELHTHFAHALHTHLRVSDELHTHREKEASLDVGLKSWCTAKLERKRTKVNRPHAHVPADETY
jgi:hypothetical protein